MEKTVIRVKGIIKSADRYLVLKRWYDDRIPDPFMWEFLDGNANFGESPVNAVKRLIYEYLSAEGEVIKPVYTWSMMVGETQIVGIAYLCSVETDDEFNLPEDFGGYEWITREEFDEYIENPYVRKDIEGIEL